MPTGKFTMSLGPVSSLSLIKYEFEKLCHHCGCFTPETAKINSFLSKIIKRTSTKLNNIEYTELLFRKSRIFRKSGMSVI